MSKRPEFDEDLEDKEVALSLATIAVLLITCAVIDAVGVAFIYKVYNERQMTREYHEQAVQEKRIADWLQRIYLLDVVRTEPISTAPRQEEIIDWRDAVASPQVLPLPGYAHPL